MGSLEAILEVAEQFSSLGTAIQEQVMDVLRGHSSYEYADEDDPLMTPGAASYVRERLVPALERLLDCLDLDELEIDIEDFVENVPEGEVYW